MKASLVAATSLGALLVFELAPTSAQAAAVFTLNNIVGSQATLSMGDVLVGSSKSLVETATLDLTANSGNPGTIVFGTAAAPVTGYQLKSYAAQTSGTTISSSYTFTPTVLGATANQLVTVAATMASGKAYNSQSSTVTITGTGVAPVQSVSSGNNGYVLVGSSNAASVTVQNTGDANLLGTATADNLNGSVTAASGTGYSGASTPATVTLHDSNATGGATTASYAYTYAPTVKGQTSSTTVTISFSNGNSAGTNTTQTISATLTGTGVAPVETVSASNPGNNGYVLVGSTVTTTATVQNVGNGNLAGTTTAFDLNGSVSNTTSGVSGGPSSPASINLNDSNYGTGATTSQTYTYTFAPTAKGATGSAVLTATFSNGSQNGANAASGATVTMAGTGVAPVASVAGSGNYALVGNSSAVTVTVQNTGNGNLSGLGTVSNLQGTIGGASGLFTGASVALGGGSGLGDTSSTTISYTFAPTSIGTFSTSVTGTFTDGVGTTNASGNLNATLTGTGVAPAASVAVSNSGYVLVGSNASSTVTVTNTGNGNLSGLGSVSNLRGTQGAASSSVFTGGPGSINLYDSTSTGESTAAGFTYNFAPTQIGTVTTTVVTTLVNGVGSTNASGTVTSTLSGTGVAPIQTVTSGSLGYVLVNQTASASVTIQNVGNGNLAGSGGSYNLNGSVTNTASGLSGATGASSISLFDSNGTGATSQAYTYTFAPTVKGTVGTGTLTASFSNGSNNGAGQGYNQAQTVTTTLAGTAVAPVQSVTATNTNLGYLLVGSQTATSTVTQSDVGNGNLAGTGGLYNLNGSVTNAQGSGYSGGTTGSSINLTDGNGGTSATTSTFAYTFAPSVTGASTTIVTSSFSDGNGNGTNAAQTVQTTIVGTGVAPVASISATNNGYVLVKSSNTATVTVQDTGNGDLAGSGGLFNLNGSVSAATGSTYSGTSGPSSFNLADGNASGGATTSTYTYTFAPTVIGNSSTVVSATFTNGIGTSNSAGSASVTLTGTGVAPIETVAVANATGNGGTANTGQLGYVLVNSTQAATATVTQADIGNANLLGTGYPYDLRGSVSNVTGSGFSGGTNGRHVSLQDSNATTGATTSAFTYTFAPTVTGAASTTVTSNFRNGSADGTNNAQTVVNTLTGTGVAPVASISSSGNSGYVLVTTSNTTTVTVQDTGNGNLAGSGGAFNLNGSVSASGGTGYSGGTGSFSLQDSNIGATTSSYTYTFAPSSVGSASAVVTGSFTNGIGNTNSSGSQGLTLTGTGVAPIQTVSSSNAIARINKYADDPNSQTGTASVTVANVGDGSLAGSGTPYNLNATVGNTLGSGFSGGTTGSTISVLDSYANGGSAGTSTYTYTFAPTARGVATTTVNIAFSNGNSAGNNLSQTVAASVAGTGVGPTYQSSVTALGIDTPTINSQAGKSIINFGTVGYRSSTIADLYLANITTDPNGGDASLTTLTINSDTISTGDLTDFTVGNVAGTEIAEGGGTIELQITLTANAGGLLNSLLTINTDENAPLGETGDTFYYALNADVTGGPPVPEPASMAVLGVGLAGLGWARRRRKTDGKAE